MLGTLSEHDIQDKLVQGMDACVVYAVPIQGKAVSCRTCCVFLRGYVQKQGQTKWKRGTWNLLRFHLLFSWGLLCCFQLFVQYKIPFPLFYSMATTPKAQLDTRYLTNTCTNAKRISSAATLCLFCWDTGGLWFFPRIRHGDPTYASLCITWHVVRPCV